MQTRNREEICLPLTLCTTVLLVTMSAIIGIIGTVLYVSEKNAEATYKPTMCFVKNYTIIQQTCSETILYRYWNLSPPVQQTIIRVTNSHIE